MFQNDMIAKQAGQDALRAAIRNGANAQEAARAERDTTAAKMIELDTWTVENVGLD